MYVCGVGFVCDVECVWCGGCDVGVDVVWGVCVVCACVCDVGFMCDVRCVMSV